MIAAEPRMSPRSLCEVLADLYKRQLACTHELYLEQHGRPRVIAGQVKIFRRYLPHLPPRGAVLDWGCRHAPDSCLLRAARGDAYELYGCDFPEPGSFDVFHSYAGLCYRQLGEVVHIPFPDQHFDAVVGSGTLEHAAMDYESLKELHRVLKPDGVLVITYLPNRLSYEEFLMRSVWKKPCHRRLYSPGQVRRQLLHTGFHPVEVSYVSRFWETKVCRLVRSPVWAARLAAPLNLVLPVRAFLSSTLFAVARKVTVM